MSFLSFFLFYCKPHCLKSLLLFCSSVILYSSDAEVYCCCRQYCVLNWSHFGTFDFGFSSRNQWAVIQSTSCKISHQWKESFDLLLLYACHCAAKPKFVVIEEGVSWQAEIACVQVSRQLTIKYGKEYVEMCRRNGFETVNEKVRIVCKC